MILEVIVTTMNENILQLIDNFYKQFDNVIYFISHQIINKEANLYIKQVNKFLKKRTDVKYFYYYEKGLSRNRNRSMEVSTGDICLVTDDDIVFKEGAFQNIFQAFKKIPEADIITFSSEFPDGTRFKRYRNKIFLHNARSCMRISSFEIAYRRASIEKVGLNWDENFGLGGNLFTNGMENIFMIDALRAGLKAYFYPEIIAIHPFDNSGFNYDNKDLILGKGGMFARMFEKKAYLLNVLFALKKYFDYHKSTSFFEFIKLANRGSRQYLDYLKKGKSRKC